MAVPCELVTDQRQQFVQTYAIKFARDVSATALQTWANGQGIFGAGAYAVVRLPVTEELYLALTLGQSHRFQKCADTTPYTPPKW